MRSGVCLTLFPPRQLLSQVAGRYIRLDLRRRDAVTAELHLGSERRLNSTLPRGERANRRFEKLAPAVRERISTNFARARGGRAVPRNTGPAMQSLQHAIDPFHATGQKEAVLAIAPDRDGGATGILSRMCCTGVRVSQSPYT